MRKIVVMIIILLFLSGGAALAALKDNGDGTVTDNSTGLMWQKATAPGTYYWFDAMAYCEGLILAGHEDWRLPDLDELRSLVYWSSGTPSDTPTIDPLLASNTVAAYYWSSDFEQQYGEAWRVSFSKSGYDWSVSVLTAYYVRAVRGGIRSLSISKSGGGGGTVSSVPAGINCGSQCSSSFDYATLVTLTATPDSLSVFTGWSGGGCSGTSTTCQVRIDVSKTVTATFTADTTGPTGTVTINGGGAYTRNPAVNLTLSASDPSGLSQMQFSNDNAAWSTAETYGTTKAWTLSSGDGSKTVYVKFKDNKGNWSGSTTATIALDTRAPVTTATPPAGTYNAAQNITLAADETATIYYTTDGATPNTGSAVYSAPIIVNTSKTIKFFASDTAGNTETVKSASYTIDTSGPTGGTIAIDGGATRTRNATVTLVLAASDTSGMSQMQFSNNGTTWSVAETYETTKVWTLSVGDGSKTVYVMYKDNAGNWSTPVSTTVTLDSTAPVTSAAPKGGEYRTKQNVTLSANEPAIIYYTTNGAEPTTTSPTYAATPIPITWTTSLKFFAQDSAGNLEIVRIEIYTINENGMPGEMNNDTRIDLADAILALQILIRQTSQKDISNYMTADVNGDGRIGLPEVMYILQKAAEMR